MFPSPLALRLRELIAAHFSEDQMIYRPSDAAQLAGISEATVTHFLRTRPDLFPARRIVRGRTVRKIEWVYDEFLRALKILANLSPTAKTVLGAA